MADGGNERKGKPRLTGRRLALGAVVLLAGLVALYLVESRRGVERRLEILRAAGCPVSAVEQAEYGKLPEGTVNAAETYMRAVAAAVPPADEAILPHRLWDKWPDRQTLVSEPAAGAYAAFLAANRECLSLLHQAAGIEHCRYGWDPAEDGRRLRELQSCSWLLALNAISQALASDPNAAVESIRDGLRLGDSFRREPQMIHYIVRIVCYEAAAGSLEQVLCLTPLTDEQLRQLSDALAASERSLDFVRAVATEGCAAIDYFRHPSGTSGSEQIDMLLQLPGVRRRILVGILDYKIRCIEAARLPETQRLAEFRRIDSELRDPPRPGLLARLLALRRIAGELGLDTIRLDVIVNMVSPRMNTGVQQDLRIRALLDMARTAVAIERYRLATGSPPADLAELVPQYLDEVSVDPFDARPIRYRREPTGYTLYSVDRDTRDDNGRDPGPNPPYPPRDLTFTVTR